MKYNSRKASSTLTKSKRDSHYNAPRMANDRSAVRSGAGETPVLRVFPFLVFALSAIAFLPALNNGFVNWDDPANLLDNPSYRGLTTSNLGWMFTTFHVSLYRPLTWLTLALDYELWGMNPAGYHLTSLLIHGANAALVYFIARHLFALTSVHQSLLQPAIAWAAVIATLFFSLHPLRVEPIAWASARNDVLAGLFFLAAIFCYLNYVSISAEGSNRRVWFLAAVIAFVLSLLSKASTVTLPVVLLILDVYPLKRLAAPWFDRSGRTIYLEKIWFVIPAAGAAGAALAAKYQYGAMATVQEAGLQSRIAQSFCGLFFYVWKAVIPIDFSPLYEMPLGLTLLHVEVVVSIVIVLALSGALWAWRHRWPAAMAAWAAYIVLLAPVLGIFQSGPQWAADRYSYLACLGFALLAGGGFLSLVRLQKDGRISDGIFRLACTLIVFVLGIYLALSWRQTKVWHDSGSLWRHALEISPSPVTHYNLGVHLAATGEIDEAIYQFRKTIQLSPSYRDADYNLARILDAQGKTDEALRHYRRAAQLAPGVSEIYANMGLLMLRRGDLENAAENFRQALRLKPNDSVSHFNLANSLVPQKRWAEAAEHYQIATKLQPDFAEAYHNLGRLLAAQGRLDEAIENFRVAIQARPDYLPARESLRQALTEKK